MNEAIANFCSDESVDTLDINDEELIHFALICSNAVLSDKLSEKKYKNQARRFKYALKDKRRGLRWTDNSCYMDSVLMAMFAENNDFINDRILNTDKYKGAVCRSHQDVEKGVENIRKIQLSLKEIREYIHYGTVYVSLDVNVALRSLLGKCKFTKSYNSSDTDSSGEFARRLFELFDTEVATIITKKYYDNPKDVFVKQRLDNRDIFVSINPGIDESENSDNGDDSDTNNRNKKISDMLDKYEKTDANPPFYERSTIHATPYVIVEINRLWTGDLMDMTIIPDEFISIDNKKLYLKSVISYVGRAHYVTYFSIDGNWYFYNDLKFPTVKPLTKSVYDLKDVCKRGILFFYSV
jgi:ubiquitin C-terminal hydrolase